MKYDLFMIFSYWKMHRRKAVAILLTYLLMMTFAIVSFGMLRTELRRVYFDNFYSESPYFDGFGHSSGCGAYNFCFNGIEEEEASALAKEPGVTQGKYYVSCYMGNEMACYTYGAYMDQTAYEMSGIRLKEGVFPKKTGETAISERALSNMGIDAGVGDVIVLMEYDGEKNAVGTRELTLVGIFRDDGTRQGWETGSQTDIYRTFEPVILLPPRDMDPDRAQLDVMVRVQNGDRFKSLPEKEQERIWVTLRKYIAAADMGYGEGAYDSSYFFSYGQEYGQHRDAKGVFYQYACFAASAVMAVCLFCSVLTVMPGKLSSMRMMRCAGYPLRRLRRMLAMEWAAFTAAGQIAGFISGVVVYELFLQAQHRFFGLDLYRAWGAEWGIRQVTYDPCLMACLLTAAASAVAFFVPVAFLKRLLSGAGRTREKKEAAPVKSFWGGVSKVFRQPLLRFLQVVSLALVLVTGCAAMMFFSTEGKDSPSNPQIQARGELFEAGSGLDMRRDGIDCVMKCRQDLHFHTIADLRDMAWGLPAETVDRLSGSGLFKNCFAWTPLHIYGCYASGVNAPRDMAKFDGFLEDAGEEYKEKATMKRLGLEQYTLYDIGTPMLVNDELLLKLGADLEEMDRGKALILPLSGRRLFEGADAISVLAYAGKPNRRKETFECMYEDVFSCGISDVMDPDASMREKEPLLYSLLDAMQGYTTSDKVDYLMLFSWNGAKKLGSMGIDRRFYRIYLTYADGTSDSDVYRLLDDVSLTKSEMDVSTLSQRKARQRWVMVREYSIVFTVFFMFVAIAFIGYVQTMKLQLLQRERQIAMLRSIGASKRKLWAHMALLLMKAPALAFLLGGAAVFGLKRFLEWMYRYSMKYSELVERAEYGSEAYAGAIARYMQLEQWFLTEYEMWKVPVAPLFLCLAAFLAAGVFLAACRIAWQAVSGDIV